VDVDVSPVDDTLSPVEAPAPHAPPELDSDLAPPPGRPLAEGAISSIRHTLESTGDIKPQVRQDAAETFMVPPSSLEEAEPLAAPDLEGDEDALDLGDTLDLGGDLDDLDEE
jgi:hypothetical protein